MAHKGLVLVYGDEDFLLDRERDAIRSKGIVHQLDCDGASGADVVKLLDAGWVDTANRTYLLDNAQDVKKPAPLQSYLESKDFTDPSVRVVAIIRAEALPPLWAAVAPKALKRTHSKPAPWKVSDQVDILRGELARVGLDAETRLLEGLIDQAGWNLGLFVREFEKLSLFLGGKGSVTREALAKVTSLQKQAEPWAVADALAARNRVRAMNLLSACYRANGDQCLVPVVVTAMRQFEKLAIVKAMQAKGATAEAIATRLGMHPFRCQQTVIPNAARFTSQEIVSAFGQLCSLDILVKGSALSKRTHVELTLLKIAS